MPSVLMILSSATTWSQLNGLQRPTGFWGEEFITPHRLLSAAGANISLATPGGAPAVVDELSLSLDVNGGDAAKVAELTDYLHRHAQLLRAPKRLEDIDLADYDAILVPGGHGPMQDLAVNEAAGRLLTAALADPRKVVGALCHGCAAFLAAGDARSWPFKGRKLTGFSNTEETQTGLAANAPWLLEDRLVAAGAQYQAGAPWTSYVVVDGNLVTGQNPASAQGTTQAFLEEIAKRR
ncbi:type 1 glutamine amidotransferase domain-containing protein [Pseudomonas gingeri NCPPB 3146 = LMG 5327]|uniref:Type 1 glutamine amidotransferase domain-containing protein n=2 Tax=Pseudomonas gingeri TaxID=117681 RepID=A0A7Y7XX07_9PSED|nr:type 1 glutamine amidotransferase domain-containing protein [Pseudomonas gingeri]NWC13581.1 type 1 glutamine amidotransferase domain-containing protein [Pseudomonas gingeri]NWE47329.1 type 1 glutamine amidotransferase domain-containing protein [Pseudomonas gingeri]PNQ90867.1 type 1 glutamine amidotransferase domain-containing protein [Pseudomonas gingeri NCPPB 3146 = LMG 5327]